MPELPDVELFKRYFDKHALHRTIAQAAVSDVRILGKLPAKRFTEAVAGARFEETRRHGKHLLVRLSKGGWLTLHFGMTGGLQYYDNGAAPPAYERVRFDLRDDGHLAYINRRMLGHVGLTDDADDFIAKEDLGPDVLAPEFDLDGFKQALAGARSDIKTVLMDQARMAGIGNIYADEILFQARLHPQTRVDALDNDAITQVFRAAKEVLMTAVKAGAGAEVETDKLPKGYLLPQREEGAKCPRCGGKIEMLRIGGRATYFCPRCQPAPRKKPAARGRSR